MWLACAWSLAQDGLDQVAALVRLGDEAGALRAIEALREEADEDSGLRYLRGRLLLDVGRPCDAMDTLAQTSPDLPEPMREDAVRRWARAAARCGRCDQARPVLLGASSKEAVVTRSDRAAAADCAVQMGDLETAAEELSRLTRRKSGLANRVALLALLSDVYVELDRPDEARMAALEAWKASVSPHQQGAASKLVERASPSLEDRLARTQQLVAARRFERAVRELEEIGAPSVAHDDDLNMRWHHLYGMALFRTRARYLDAARILYQSAQLRGPNETEDAFHSARALSRADKDARTRRSICLSPFGRPMRISSQAARNRASGARLFLGYRTAKRR